MEELDPVKRSEYLLRRVPLVEDNDWIDLNSIQPVSELAFMPHRKNDFEGISVNREYFINADKLASMVREKNNKECYVLRFKTKDILSLNPALSAIANPSVDWPGHTLIPEINRRLYNSNKSNCQDMQRKLAKLIKKKDIIHTPTKS